MKVILTSEAIDDLVRIGLYIQQDNPSRAETFVAELEDRCQRLADTPRGFPLVARYEHTGIRRRPYREYLIFYRVGIEQIEVVHILNGAQNYETILFSAS